MSTLKFDVWRVPGMTHTLDHEGVAKVLFEYDQVTPATTGSTNISSIDDNSTGLFDLNITTAMATTTHYLAGTSGTSAVTPDIFGHWDTGLTTEVYLQTVTDAGAFADNGYNSGYIVGYLS